VEPGGALPTSGAGRTIVPREGVVPQMQPSQLPDLPAHGPRALLALLLAGALPLAAGAQTPSPVPEADTAQMVSVSASGLDGVVTDADGRPLAGAVITATDRPGYALSSDKGRFVLGGLLPGRETFEVRRVGFVPAIFEIELPQATIVHIRARLQPAVMTLSAIVVEGRSRPLGLWRAGFYDRAVKQVTGYFYPPEEILRRKLTTVSNLLAEIPSVSIESRDGKVIPYGRRTGTEPCRLNVWVDDMLSAVGDDGLDVLAPGWIVRAVEVYPTASVVPDRYVRQNNLCGAVLIWTKGIVR
jgi:hypothetical protein